MRHPQFKPPVSQWLGAGPSCPQTPHPVGTAKCHLWGQPSASVCWNWGPASCWHGAPQLLEDQRSPHGGCCCAPPTCPSFASPGHLRAARLLPLPRSHSGTAPPPLLPRGRAHHLGVRAGSKPLVCSGSGTGLFPRSPGPCPRWDFCVPRPGGEPAKAWLGTSSRRRASIAPGAQRALRPRPRTRASGAQEDPPSASPASARSHAQEISARDSLKPKSHFIGTIHDS